MSTEPVVAPAPESTVDFMPLHGIDHVELYVGNALQSAYFYVHALGFKEVAYAGLEPKLIVRAWTEDPDLPRDAGQPVTPPPDRTTPPPTSAPTRP